MCYSCLKRGATSQLKNTMGIKEVAAKKRLWLIIKLALAKVCAGMLLTILDILIMIVRSQNIVAWNILI